MPRIVAQCSNENTINRGAQTKPQEDAGPVRTLLGGETSRADSVQRACPRARPSSDQAGPDSTSPIENGAAGTTNRTLSSDELIRGLWNDGGGLRCRVLLRQAFLAKVHSHAELRNDLDYLIEGQTVLLFIMKGVAIEIRKDGLRNAVDA
jgi:hypothetical protein